MLHMLRTRHTRRTTVATAALALPFVAAVAPAQAAPSAGRESDPEERDRDRSLRAGAAYTLTNEVAGNRVAIFRRAADGSLAAGGAVATGGTGTGTGLGSQGALALSKNGEWLYAVNAGSNDVSVLRVTAGWLELVQRISSGGTMPI